MEINEISGEPYHKARRRRNKYNGLLPLEADYDEHQVCQYDTDDSYDDTYCGHLLCIYDSGRMRERVRRS